jgi:hypothetical protein
MIINGYEIAGNQDVTSLEGQSTYIKYRDWLVLYNQGLLQMTGQKVGTHYRWTFTKPLHRESTENPLTTLTNQIRNAFEGTSYQQQQEAIQYGEQVATQQATSLKPVTQITPMTIGIIGIGIALLGLTK